MPCPKNRFTLNLLYLPEFNNLMQQINLIGNSFDNLIKGTRYNRAPAGGGKIVIARIPITIGRRGNPTNPKGIITSLRSS